LGQCTEELNGTLKISLFYSLNSIMEAILDAYLGSLARLFRNKAR
jgi:hypothetical protein